jgi:hypothetical protein
MSEGADSAAAAGLFEALGGVVAGAGARLLATRFEGGAAVARVETGAGQAVDALFAPAESRERALCEGPELRFWYQPVGVEHGQGDGSEGLRALVAALERWVLGGGQGALAAVLRGRAFDARRVRQAQLPWLVAQGHKPAAIVLASGDEVRRGRWLGEVPAGVYSEFAIRETGTGKIVVGGAGGEARFLYCAEAAEAAERLRELDRLVLTEASRDAERARAWRLEQGLMLGYPECCALWFSAQHAVDSPHDEMWLALGAGDPAEAGEPLANFVMAAVYGLAFFAHVPCGPRCAATVAQNRALMEAVFDGPTRGRIEALLGLSAVVWPGGELWVFRARGVAGGAVRVEAVEEWPAAELVGARRGARRVGALLGSAEEDRGIEALRVGGGVLEVRVGGVWRAVEGPGRAAAGPRLAVYGAGETR